MAHASASQRRERDAGGLQRVDSDAGRRREREPGDGVAAIGRVCGAAGEA